MKNEYKKSPAWPGKKAEAKMIDQIIKQIMAKSLFLISNADLIECVVEMSNKSPSTARRHIKKAAENRIIVRSKDPKDSNVIVWKGSDDFINNFNQYRRTK